MSAEARDMRRGLEESEALRGPSHQAQHQRVAHGLPLDVFERNGGLHFVSRGYYFDLGIRRNGRHSRVPLPAWLSAGTTHVEHVDESASGWFRFTMAVTHPVFGELFYQTGRFRAAGG
jgi:hypothetical protein